MLNISSINSDPYGDYGSMEPRVTLEMFLQGSTGKVTVLVGQSGSGKTLLMSNLGQQWARGLVSLHYSHHSVTSYYSTCYYVYFYFFLLKELCSMLEFLNLLSVVIVLLCRTNQFYIIF